MFFFYSGKHEDAFIEGRECKNLYKINLGTLTLLLQVECQLIKHTQKTCQIESSSECLQSDCLFLCVFISNSLKKTKEYN